MNTTVEQARATVRATPWTPLTEEQKAAVASTKELGAQFLAHVQNLGHSRAISLAVTKIEEAVMWAVKHVTA